MRNETMRVLLWLRHLIGVWDSANGALSILHLEKIPRKLGWRLRSAALTPQLYMIITSQRRQPIEALSAYCRTELS
jgi:hypothetical protein